MSEFVMFAIKSFAVLTVILTGVLFSALLAIGVFDIVRIATQRAWRALKRRR